MSVFDVSDELFEILDPVSPTNPAVSTPIVTEATASLRLVTLCSTGFPGSKLVPLQAGRPPQPVSVQDGSIDAPECSRERPPLTVTTAVQNHLLPLKKIPSSYSLEVGDCDSGFTLYRWPVDYN